MLPMSSSQGKNPIMALGELCTQRKWAAPNFSERGISGPSHLPSFTMEVTVGTFTATGTDLTKQLAKAQCAKKMLEQLQASSHSGVSSTLPHSGSNPNSLSADQSPPNYGAFGIQKSASESRIELAEAVQRSRTDEHVSDAGYRKFSEQNPKESLDRLLKEIGSPASVIQERLLPLDADQSVYVVTCIAKGADGMDLVVKEAVALNAEKALLSACKDVYDFVSSAFPPRCVDAAENSNTLSSGVASVSGRRNPDETNFHYPKVLKELKKCQAGGNVTRNIWEREVKKGSKNIVEILKDIGAALGFSTAFASYPEAPVLRELGNLSPKTASSQDNLEETYLRTCKLTFTDLVRPVIILTGKSMESIEAADEDCAQNAFIYLLHMEDKVLAQSSNR